MSWDNQKDLREAHEAISDLTAQLETQRGISESVKQLNDSKSSRINKLEGAIASLFDKIKHGDEEHQTWLKNAIDEHFSLVEKGNK